MTEEQRQDQAEEPQSSEAPDRVAELEKELAEARQKAEENWNQFLRARAELENTRRRTEREIEQAHKFALENFASQLLGVWDSLEMGVAAAQDPNADVASLREGTELTLKMLTQVMEKFGIVQINPQGEKFDPSRHEAMAAQEADGVEPNTVLTVVQKGYMLHDRLLRPAMVVVSKQAAQPAGGQVDEQA
ncbi:MAG: nucleotide exchange factor GrpE [Xanthomonadaceae bacterium]|nr:nucleotide exchange factor GrpE [Xanthomonadaceae bacterium]